MATEDAYTKDIKGLRALLGATFRGPKEGEFAKWLHDELRKHPALAWAHLELKPQEEEATKLVQKPQTLGRIYSFKSGELEFPWKVGPGFSGVPAHGCQVDLIGDRIGWSRGSSMNGQIFWGFKVSGSAKNCAICRENLLRKGVRDRIQDIPKPLGQFLDDEFRDTMGSWYMLGYRLRSEDQKGWPSDIRNIVEAIVENLTSIYRVFDAQFRGTSA